MIDLSPLETDIQAHQLLHAFMRISRESTRREAIALVARLAEADAHDSKNIKPDQVSAQS